MKPYQPQRGDLVLTPEQLPAIVESTHDGYVSVFAAPGWWKTYYVGELVPFVTNEPRPRTANFAAILKPDLESFAPGFRGRSRDAEVDRLLDTIAREDEDPHVIALATDRVIELLSSSEDRK